MTKCQISCHLNKINDYVYVEGKDKIEVFRYSTFSLLQRINLYEYTIRCSLHVGSEFLIIGCYGKKVFQYSLNPSKLFNKVSDISTEDEPCSFV